MSKSKTSKTSKPESTTAHPKTRALRLAGVHAEGGLFTEKDAKKDGTRRFAWVPGRDASFAALCLRVARGKADKDDTRLLAEVQEHPAFESKVASSAYLSGKLAQANAA